MMSTPVISDLLHELSRKIVKQKQVTVLDAQTKQLRINACGFWTREPGLLPVERMLRQKGGRRRSALWDVVSFEAGSLRRTRWVLHWVVHGGTGRR